MNYEEEFEKLLDVAEQALGGIDLENRKVLGSAGVFLLQEVVRDYRSHLTTRAADVCPNCETPWLGAKSLEDRTDEICAACGHRR